MILIIKKTNVVYAWQIKKIQHLFIVVTYVFVKIVLINMILNNALFVSKLDNLLKFINEIIYIELYT